MITTTLRDTDTHSYLLRNLLWNSVPQSILQHNANASSCHGYTILVPAKVSATSFILSFFGRWLHALHENIASPHIRKFLHTSNSRLSSTHYGFLGNLCVYIYIYAYMIYREGKRVWRLPEPSESKITSWFPRDLDPKTLVLARASSNLAASLYI
jgi:hypothetical protein